MSGVVLANASLDIAFHDKHFSLFNTSLKKEQNKLNKEYIKIFWVGLMDGDGNIQVNHWRMKYLQYRVVIKLKNNSYNKFMLIDIAKHIKGTVRITRNKKDIIWVLDDKKEIIENIKIFDKFPPLTSRLNCQLRFLKECLKKQCIKTYVKERNNKYNIQPNLIKSNKNMVLPHYFASWLSGFIEAEGCFSIRNKGYSSFSISQNNDTYILDVIKNFFNIENKIRNPYSNFYLIETSKKATLISIVGHCDNYPLLGHKSQSLNKLKICL